MKLDSDTDFSSQLRGNFYYAGESLPWHIVSAFQITKFELFEGGAKVRVDTGIIDGPFGDPPKPTPVTPRNFICDQAFYLFLWKNEAELPYLAVWIDSVDSLKFFQK